MASEEQRIKWKQQKRLYRQNNVIRDLWHNLRHHAKERNKTCGISLEAFTRFCLETNYHLLKGSGKELLHIDRIKDEIGYEEGNIRVLSGSNNVIKEHLRRQGIDFEPWIEVFTEQPF